MKHKKIVLALAAAGLCAGALPAHAAGDADRIAQLEKQLKLLQEQVEAMKKSAATTQEVADLRDQVTAQGKEAVVAGDIPNSFRVPGSDTSVRVYGIAELNMVRESKGDNSATDYSTFAPYIPLNGSDLANRKGQTYLHGRTSRIGIEGATPTQYGMAMFKVEGDFNNDPRTGNSAVTGSLDNIYTQQATNSYGFRLRHAYLQVGPWLFGQTWSTFMDIDSTPETVDFNGPIGSTFIRQPMIRYTHTTPTYGNFTAAVENSVSYVIDPAGSATTAGFSKSPDLIGRWDKAYNWGTVSLRGVSHEHRIDGTVATVADPVDISRRGFGLAASGTIKAVGDDTISWIVTGGKGIGRYFNYIEGAAYNKYNNTIELEKAVGLVLGYQHKANDQWRFNFVYGTQKSYENGYTTIARESLGDEQYAANRRISQLHVGGFYSPAKPMELGLEYIYGKRETVFGDQGNMSRVNFLARYNLN
ncbi:DcaP family trimeric outer membrane transporter [Rhodocyclus tenuis]|uniref:Porin n=1 Tax=Rhodocyclus tenuis TaxID=1066 RepID=A0A840GIC3_RHOTE|nr:DcaP family trimeric outer membrane transporter [Rhodocyclus tenuis]MBB4248222.1 hypothetical protein [Rhodocyclus tenuis]MBK1679064.1 hypothetical protein [Rhodocyclus tenuis]